MYSKQYYYCKNHAITLSLVLAFSTTYIYWWWYSVRKFHFVQQRPILISRKSFKFRFSRFLRFYGLLVLLQLEKAGGCWVAGFLKHFAIFTGKHPSWTLLLINLLAFKLATLLKRDSNTGCKIQWNFRASGLKLHWQETASTGKIVPRIASTIVIRNGKNVLVASKTKVSKSMSLMQGH